jgi:general secretion pathway protein G
MASASVAVTAQRSRAAGFTLVELMLVVIIISVLAAVVVPRLVGKTRRASEAAAEMTLQSVATSLEQFELDVQRFPSTEEGLEALMIRPPALAPEAQWNGPYLKEPPLDPWHRRLIYRFPGERAVDYDLLSVGADGQEGSPDDISNFRTTEAVQ